MEKKRKKEKEEKAEEQMKIEPEEFLRYL